MKWRIMHWIWHGLIWMAPPCHVLNERTFHVILWLCHRVLVEIAAFNQLLLLIGSICAHIIWYFFFFLFCRADLVLYWYGQFSFETIRFRLMLGGRQFNGNDWRVRKDSHFKQQKKEEEQEQEMIWWWKTTSNLESSKPPLINNKNPFKFNNYCRITTVQWMLIWPK